MIKKSIKNSKEKIRIDFSIENSSNGNYSVQAKLYNDEQVLDFFSEIKESFVKQTLNFEKFFSCDFIFEKQQDIEITLKKNDKEIKINTTLGGIVGSRNSKVVYKYAGDESFVIKATKLGNWEDLLDVKFVLKEDNQQEKSNFFVKNKFYYFITCNNKKIYKSSFISKDGTFENIYIPTWILQPNYTISIYNSFNQYIYSFINSIEQIKSHQKIGIKIPINNKSFFLEDKSVIIQNFSFIDYINSGIKIALSIGIDFTHSNGNPFEYGTYHSIRGNNLNDYERAIFSCGKIVGSYDYDQKFPVYGFGAIVNSINRENKLSMCFNLNFSENPDITSIENVLKYYRNCIQKKKLIFSGPNNFAPLIKRVLSKINKNDIFEYHILMILTNGIINDLQPTIDALVAASSFPLSVIIIGIGKADFKKMEILDGDEVPLISSSGKKWKRDLVQFVPFAKYENNEKKLAMEVLAEIPRQIVEFYRCKNLNPLQIKELNKKISRKSQFVSNSDYFSNKNIKITKNTFNNSRSSDINYNQNIQTARNTYNNQSTNNSNINSIRNNNLENKTNSITHRVIQNINNIYTDNNMFINTNSSNNHNQGYSDRGDIYSQGNNINQNNNSLTQRNYSDRGEIYSQGNINNHNNNSFSQRNYSNMANPFYMNGINNNENFSHSHSHNLNNIINNNFSNNNNNIINICNTNNIINNPHFNDSMFDKLPLHETIKLSKK